MRPLPVVTVVFLGLVGCGRSGEQPFLTPPPPPSSEAAPAAAPSPAAVPAPTPPPRPAAAPTPPPTEGQPAAARQEEGEAIAASHILVMHRESMRVPPGITRSRDEARARAEEVLRRARSGQDFAELARNYSDEPGAAARGGSLGRFRRGTMVPPFEQAAFALQVNQVSGIVETPFGFHIIRRTQ